MGLMGCYHCTPHNFPPPLKERKFNDRTIVLMNPCWLFSVLSHGLTISTASLVVSWCGEEWGGRASDGRLTGVQPEPETSDRVSGSDSDTRSGRYRGQSGAWAAGATQGQLLNFTFYNTLHHAIGARIGLKRIQQQHCQEKVLVFSQS